MYFWSVVKIVFLMSSHKEKNTLEPKAECYANDKLKSPPVFWLLYDNF